jgi:hypothetical protein
VVIGQGDLNVTIIYSRAILYPGEESVETSVEFDPSYRLIRDGTYYVHIKGSGGDVATVNTAHITHLIEWLSLVRDLDLEYRATRKEI